MIGKQTPVLCLAVGILGLLTSLPQPALAEIKVDADFPGGSGVVQDINQAQGYIRLLPQDYPNRGWRCWWYVRLSGLKPGQPITLEVGDAPWATPNQASFSTDGGETWQLTEPGARVGKRIRYSLQLDVSSVQVAWGPPFVPSDATKLVNRLADASPDAAAFSLCQTRENRDTPALVVASPLAERSDAAAAVSRRPTVTDKKRALIWIQARQHAWESGASWVCRGFAEWIVSDAPAAVRLRQQSEIVIVPIMDIDNVQRGAGGKNQKPQDHNRDWSDAPHWRAVAAAQRELQTAALDGRLAAFVDLHNPSAGDKQPYFYLPPDELLPDQGRKNLAEFLRLAEENITGPLKFGGKTIESGSRYDPKMWEYISKNWVARLRTPAVAVTLETAWNTPASTTTGYMTVGRQLGETLSAYMQSRP